MELTIRSTPSHGPTRRPGVYHSAPGIVKFTPAQVSNSLVDVNNHNSTSLRTGGRITAMELHLSTRMASPYPSPPPPWGISRDEFGKSKQLLTAVARPLLSRFW